MGFFSQAHSHRRFDTDAVDLDFSQASSAHAGGSLDSLAAGGGGVSVASIPTPEPITSRISIGTHKYCALKMDLCTGFHQFAPTADLAVFAEKLEEKHAGEEVQEQAEADPRTMARDQAGRCGGSSLPALLSAQRSLAVLEEVAGRPPRATAVISLPAFSPP